MRDLSGYAPHIVNGYIMALNDVIEALNDGPTFLSILDVDARTFIRERFADALDAKGRRDAH